MVPCFDQKQAEEWLQLQFQKLEEKRPENDMTFFKNRFSIVIWQDMEKVATPKFTHSICQIGESHMAFKDT